MSLTLIQRFYEVAKQESEAPALSIEVEGHFQSSPWWLVKSKAKHFALGLLEDGAEPGNYFYLLSSRHPHWIYAELGALTIGLQTLPLPSGISRAEMEKLFKKFPPAFIFLGREGLAALQNMPALPNSLKRLILEEDPPQDLESSSGRPLSFRRIFNEGIRRESAHHARYRELRQTLSEDAVMSPLWSGLSGAILEKPLRYLDINQAVAKLSFLIRGLHLKRIFWDLDFSDTWGRIVGVYWPIFQALQFSFPAASHFSFDLLKNSSCQLAFLKKESLSPFFELFQAPPEALALRGRPNWLGFFKRHWTASRVRKKWGRPLHWIFHQEALPEGMSTWYRNFLGLHWVEIPESLKSEG